jgi:hypothetical protein
MGVVPPPKRAYQVQISQFIVSEKMLKVQGIFSQIMACFSATDRTARLFSLNLKAPPLRGQSLMFVN